MTSKFLYLILQTVKVKMYMIFANEKLTFLENERH